eukprot:TRINITY_DN610_c0_g2_i7.p1 TRINITY_DN610_c0_g2~~TRINITY_DN610_c0_g2_i7.p1  ORF type:complete len:250 (+),score=-7.99 TRINITY_DN610_c0_g2_i7:1863-2612(+)
MFARWAECSPTSESSPLDNKKCPPRQLLGRQRREFRLLKQQAAPKTPVRSCALRPEQAKKTPVRASALRLSSQMALSLRLLPWGRLHLLLRLLVWYVVVIVRPAKTAPKQRKRCVPHSRGTASDILEEGGDDVKSAWPLWAGPHTCYNGNYNGKQGCKAERIRKDCLSSDCSLQLGNMKLESLVIADQHAAVNMYPGPVHTARHTLGIGFARSIGPMITHDFCVPLVPQRLLVVLLAHTTVGSSTGVKS